MWNFIRVRLDPRCTGGDNGGCCDPRRPGTLLRARPGKKCQVKGAEKMSGSLYGQNNSLDFAHLLFWPPYGAEGGYNAENDALVQVLADGTDLNAMWAELRSVLSTWNAERSAFAQLLSYRTTDTASAVPQSISDESFEEASEFGEPTSLRIPSAHLLLGYDFRDYDRATRFTWKFLRSATAEQVRASVDGILAADNKLVNGLILRRMFDNQSGTNEWGNQCYPAWSADGVVPPAWAGKTFEGTHTHYIASGSTDLDSGDLEAAFDHITEHGYGVEPASQLLVFMNPAQAKVVSTFKASIENNNGQKAAYDYVPSAGAPPYLLPVGQQIQGTPAPGTYNGLKVEGSYGPGLLMASYYIPSGYFAVVASNGPNSPLNLVGFREHQNTAYQGLRQIPGGVAAYPLQESFFTRACGTGVRHRGAGVVTQLTAGSYTPPAIAI